MGTNWGSLEYTGTCGHANFKVTKEYLPKQNEFQLYIMDLSGAILRKS